MADELLRALGKRQREEPAAAVPSETNDQTMHPSTAGDERAGDMLRPFDEGERASLLDAVFERLDAGGEAGGADDEDEPTTVAAPSADAAKVVELLPRRSRMRVGVIAIAASLAAALLLWLVVRPAQTPDRPAVAALPEYTITQLRGGDATMRSEPSAPPSAITLAPGKAIDFIVTPSTPVHGPVGVAVLATPERGAPVLTRVEAEISAEGVVRLRGPIDALGPDAPGTWTVDLLVARPEALPNDADAAMADGPWSRSRIEVTIASE
jgi:hypothetical protein